MSTTSRKPTTQLRLSLSSNTLPEIRDWIEFFEGPPHLQRGRKADCIDWMESYLQENRQAREICQEGATQQPQELTIEDIERLGGSFCFARTSEDKFCSKPLPCNVPSHGFSHEMAFKRNNPSPKESKIPVSSLPAGSILRIEWDTRVVKATLTINSKSSAVIAMPEEGVEAVEISHAALESALQSTTAPKKRTLDDMEGRSGKRDLAAQLTDLEKKDSPGTAPALRASMQQLLPFSVEQRCLDAIVKREFARLCFADLLPASASSITTPGIEDTLELATAADSGLRVTTRAKKRVPLNNATEWAAAFNNFLPLMAHVYGSTCAQELYKFNGMVLELAQIYQWSAVARFIAGVCFKLQQAWALFDAGSIRMRPSWSTWLHDVRAQTFYGSADLLHRNNSNTGSSAGNGPSKKKGKRANSAGNSNATETCRNYANGHCFRKNCKFRHEEDSDTTIAAARQAALATMPPPPARPGHNGVAP